MNNEDRRRLNYATAQSVTAEMRADAQLHNDMGAAARSAILRLSAKARIQRELSIVQTIQIEYERYCEEERAADRIPKEIDEWQRSKTLKQ